jgi:histidine triad (HIT) family protein
MTKCVFCKIVAGKSKCWNVYEDDLVLAFFDINPEAPGHTLVVPKKHFKDIYDVEDKYLERIALVCKRIALIYKKSLGIDEINLIHGSGKNAQQDVFHFHIHIWPRNKGESVKLKYKIRKEIVSDFDKLLAKIRKK